MKHGLLWPLLKARTAGSAQLALLSTVLLLSACSDPNQNGPTKQSLLSDSSIGTAATTQAEKAEKASAVIPVTTAEWEARIFQEGLVLVDFWSEDCPPCMALKPTLERFAEQEAGRVKVYSLHAYDESMITMQQDVAVLPTLILFKNGKEISRNEGLIDQQGLQKLVNQSN